MNEKNLPSLITALHTSVTHSSPSLPKALSDPKIHPIWKSSSPAELALTV